MNPIIIEKAPAIVKVRLDPIPINLPLEIRHQHELYWQEQTKTNSSLRNGEVFTITNIEQTERELVVTVAKTDYKHYLYTLNHEDCEEPCKVIYTCAAVITSDKKMAIGRMNRTTSTPGRLQFTGGGLDESDLEDTTFNLEKNICKEIKEELGLDIHSPSTRSFIPKFMKRKGTHDFWAIIYELSVEYTAEEVHARFLTHNHDLIEMGQQPEFDDLLFVPIEKSAVEAFIQHESSPMVDYLAPILVEYTES
ncbi:NUDIX hydrolase [Bacillus sp. JJ1474]|uniref:NUDIX hydrolase n=1 Tax=Bacillus sp. JJ1474 TaxID=3122955 RepID=UPI00300005BF